MPKGHNDFVATPQLNQFGAAYTPLDETNYSGAQSAGANVFGAGINESTQAGQGQGSLAALLQQQATGQGGPTVAQQQLQSALAQNQKQAASAIASQRGLNPALGARLIGNQQAQAGMTAAGQSAQLRSQEMLNAQNALGNVLAQQRQGAQGQAALGSNLFGNAGQLQNAQNATRVQNGLGTQQLNLQAALGNQNAMTAAQQINAGVSQNNTNAQNAILGTTLGTTGAVVGGVLGGPLGAAAGNAAGGNGGDIAQAPVKLAMGGAVPASASGTDPMERPSFAEMVAHHLVRLDGIQHLAKGGAVKGSTPYNFPALDVRSDANTEGQTAAQPGQEGTDSEGKKKVLRLAGGGLITMSQGNPANAPSATSKYQQAISSGMTPVDALKSLGPDDIKALAVASGNPINALPQNWDRLARGLPAVNTDTAIPQAQKQQQPIGVQEFNPGDFGGLATTMMNHNTGAAPNTPMPMQIHPAAQAFMQGAAAARGAPVAAPVPMVAGAAPAQAQPMRLGGRVPGQASVPGDSKENDTVPAMLSPGEIVIPRSLANSPVRAKKFIEHLMEIGEVE